MTVETTLFLPCNEGSGTTLTNTAGPGTKTASALAGDAWDKYDATTRPAVAISQSMTGQDVINSTPYNVLGNAASPAPYNPMTFGLLRFEGALAISNFRFGGADTLHGVVKAGSAFAFSAGSANYHSKSFTTNDRVFGFAAFTKGAATDLVTTWAVIEYSPADWSVVSTNSGTNTIAEPDAGSAGYLDNGGYAIGTTDFIVGGGDVEMYGLMHARVAAGVTPAVAVSGATMATEANAMFQAWRAGTKTIPAAITALATSGSGRRNRARRMGGRR